MGSMQLVKEITQWYQRWVALRVETGPPSSSVSVYNTIIFLLILKKLFLLTEAEDQIKKLQSKIQKQKKEEKRLNREFVIFYGSNDLALEK